MPRPPDNGKSAKVHIKTRINPELKEWGLQNKVNFSHLLEEKLREKMKQTELYKHTEIMTDFTPIESCQKTIDFLGTEIVIKLEKFAYESGFYPVEMGDFRHCLNTSHGWIVTTNGVVLGQIDDEDENISISVLSPNLPAYLNLQVHGISSMTYAIHNLVVLFKSLNPKTSLVAEQEKSAEENFVEMMSTDI